MRRRDLILAAAGAAGAGLCGARGTVAASLEPVGPPKRVGIALVGLGGYGRFALERLVATPEVRLAAFVTGDRAKAKAWARDFGLSDVALYGYDDFDRLADDERVDAVHICLPVGLHAPIGTRALDAGKHVLCEKPLATSAQEALDLIELASRRQRILMPAYRAWFSAHLQELLRRVREQTHGPLIAIDAHKGFRIALPPGHWRFRRDLAGGGCLVDIGLYSIQLCRWIAGRAPRRVMAVAAYDESRGGRAGLEDHLGFTLDFGEGVVATGSASWRHRLQNRAQVATRDAWLRLDPATPAIGEQLDVGLDAPARIETVLLPARDQLPAMYRHFAESVRTGHPPDIAATDALTDLVVVDALYEAARLGRWVDLPAAVV